MPYATGWRGHRASRLVSGGARPTRLGQKDEARQWYNRAVEWMEKNQPEDEELRHFRAEAAELLGMKTGEEARVGHEQVRPAASASPDSSPAEEKPEE